MNRLKKNYTRGHPTNAIYLKLYGNYTTNIYNIAGIDVFPLYGVVLKKTLSFKQEICNYTKEGRNLIHNKLNDNLQMLMKYLLKNRDENETIKFNDNRISKLAGQNGKSYITGVQLDIDNMRCCRQLPKNKGGSDDYSNLIWITAKEKELIAKVEVFNSDLVGVELDNKALKRLNSLRLLVENLPI